MQEYARGIGDHIRLEAFQIRVDRSKWNMNERNRVIAVLGWRRQETVQHLGISRKVLWEKMRKFQIFDEEPETRPM
ncbi:hypothetical protein CR51_30905 [Caballeronia megalochromosomata]|nr:hypothetical protein CR51_30905 [Caballeronia megalochromosomata]